MESPFEVRVRPARLADQAALTELDAIAWSAESGFPSVMAPDQRNATFFDAGNPPDLRRLHDRFKPDRTAIPYVAVELTPLTVYDELAAVCQPKAGLVLDGGVA